MTYFLVWYNPIAKIITKPKKKGTAKESSRKINRLILIPCPLFESCKAKGKVHNSDRKPIPIKRYNLIWFSFCVR